MGRGLDKAVKFAVIEPIRKSVSMRGGDRLYDAQFARWVRLKELQAGDVTHVSIGYGGKRITINAALKQAQCASGGVTGFTDRLSKVESERR